MKKRESLLWTVATVISKLIVVVSCGIFMIAVTLMTKTE